MDVWLTQVGSAQFYNLTRGSAPELVNPSVRTMGFTPDGSLVTFWVRKQNGSSGDDISIWAVPTLGGQPRPYLEGVAELLAGGLHSGRQITVKARKGSAEKTFQAVIRIDTPGEVRYYQHGGILQYVLRQLLGQK